MAKIELSTRMSIKNYIRLFGEDEYQNKDVYPMILVNEFGSDYEIIYVKAEDISKYKIVGNVPAEDVEKYSADNQYNFVVFDDSEDEPAADNFI